VLLPWLLIMAQPDLGTGIVFIGIFFAMLFWSGVAWPLLVMAASPAVSLILAFRPGVWGAWFLMLLALVRGHAPYVVEGVVLVVANVAMGVVAPILWDKLNPYQQRRLLVFLDPSSDPRASGYHVIQSQVAIGSGGLGGKGFTAGSQKRLAFLPEQHTDFIYSVVGEELGFLGRHARARPLLPLPARTVRIATRAANPFSLAGGVRPHGRQLVHAHHRERGDDGRPDADHGDPAAVLLLRRLVHARLLDRGGDAGADLGGGTGARRTNSSWMEMGDGRAERSDARCSPCRLPPPTSHLPPASSHLTPACPSPPPHPPFVMAWFRKEKKPRQPRRERLEIPADAWEKCEACGHTDIREKFVRNHNVCPVCDYHRRLRAHEYVSLLLDDGSVDEKDVETRLSVDPLGSRSTRRG
jgi:hypothetical protein